MALQELQIIQESLELQRKFSSDGYVFSGSRPQTVKRPRDQEEPLRSRPINAELSASSPASCKIDELDSSALLHSIKICGIQKDSSKGSRLHVQILKRGFMGWDTHLCTALLHMYAKCGALSKAQELFDELPHHDIVSWNAIISGYAQQGSGHEALRCFDQMRAKGLQPVAATYVCALKACGSIGAADKGEEIHSEIRRQGLLGKNLVLGTALVDMYAKCGALVNAQEVFDELPARNRVTWNVLISGYAQHGFGDKALHCFKQMKEKGHSPDAVSFVGALKACSSMQATQKGEEIHKEIDKQGLLPKNVVLGTALVDMYAKCGVLSKAREVFDRLPARDLALWNALLAGYSQHGLGKTALDCFEKMRQEGFFPDEVTFVCVSKACGSIGAIEAGEAMHAEVRRRGLLKKNILLGTAVVDMYAKFGVMEKAQEVFDELPIRTVASWTALIAGYAQQGKGNAALSCFEKMKDEGHSPNEITFVCALKACTGIGAVGRGEDLLIEISRQGLLRKSTLLGNAVVDMYAKCRMFAKAKEVFDELPMRDVSSWNSLITGYIDHGFSDQAVNCLRKMQDDGVVPDAVTFVCILKACGHIQAVKMGEQIHEEVRRQGLLGKHAMLATTLVDMYAKCGVLAKAQEAFDEIPIRDVASWTALIGGYSQHGLGDEALCCFEQMQKEGCSPNAITYICILKACGSIGAAEMGEKLHAEISKQDFLEEQYLIDGALVDMYAKCGAMPKAQEVFDELLKRDVISWTALIAGYAQFGCAKTVFDSFCKMIGEHVEPNTVTFSVLLNTCSHAGLVEEGQMYFDLMSTVYCITPTIEHLICIVDLFSRAGQFDQAMSIIEEVPLSDACLLWSALLGGCQMWANMELGRWAFEHAVVLDAKYPGAYVGMSNLYAAGTQEGSE